MGVIFAVIALGCWGIGDFLIQRSARKFGDWIALFFITAFASIVLLPFVWNDLITLEVKSFEFLILIIASLVLLIAGLLDFEALRVGKISVVEPIYALEMLITTFLAAILIHEKLTLLQYTTIGFLIFGIFLISTKSFHHFKNIHLEKGVWLAVLAMVGMGSITFLFGVGAREASPLMINWFTSAFVAVAALIYLASQKRLPEIIIDWQKNKKLILSVSVVDNLAWVAFAFGTTYAPIAIVAGISETYIVLASALGLIFNKEKLQKHQWIGFVITVIAAVVLTLSTNWQEIPELPKI